MEPFISQIALFSFDYAPRGWAQCNGQILPINQNQALFSLLGTTFGGDGRVTFALPDLRGRVVVGNGQGPGLQNYVMGQYGGSATVTLGRQHTPPHTHAVNGTATVATTNNPSGALFAQPAVLARVGTLYGTPGGTQTVLAADIIRDAGGSPHSNIQPCLTLNYCIALVGIYPSRN